MERDVKISEGRRLQEETMNDPYSGSDLPKVMPDESMAGRYAPLEKYLRDLPVSQEDVTLTFESIEAILKEPLPASARKDYPWWENQKPGIQVKTNAWMDAGWMVEIVDLVQRWVRFVRQ